MLVRIDDPDYAPKLSVFLKNSGFGVSRGQDGHVEVTGGDANLLARVLSVWNGLHEDAQAEIISPDV